MSGLTVDRGGRRVLENISFALEPGQALLLTGPNGVGKSTLIRSLIGAVHRSEGTVTLAGPGIEEPDDVARHCHYLGHRDAIKTALSVRENLAFWQDFLGRGHGTSVAEALAAVDLADLADLPAAYLSAGQRRRLAIARLVAVGKPIWLLDEPTAALDRQSEARLVALIAEHVARGGSMLAATHLAINLPTARSLRLSPVDHHLEAEW